MNDDGLLGFADRLNALCDEKKIPYRGRAELLGKRFNVSREAARKWLKGIAYPTLAMRVEIGAWAGVTDSWLVTGKGDKVPPVSGLTPQQRAVLEYMQTMPLDQQQLVLRLVAQVLDLPVPEIGNPRAPSGANKGDTKQRWRDTH